MPTTPLWLVLASMAAAIVAACVAIDRAVRLAAVAVIRQHERADAHEIRQHPCGEHTGQKAVRSYVGDESVDWRRRRLHDNGV